MISSRSYLRRGGRPVCGGADAAVRLEEAGGRPLGAWATLAGVPQEAGQGLGSLGVLEPARAAVQEAEGGRQERRAVAAAPDPHPLQGVIEPGGVVGGVDLLDHARRHRAGAAGPAAPGLPDRRATRAGAGGVCRQRGRRGGAEGGAGEGVVEGWCGGGRALRGRGRGCRSRSSSQPSSGIGSPMFFLVVLRPLFAGVGRASARISDSLTWSLFMWGRHCNSLLGLKLCNPFMFARQWTMFSTNVTFYHHLISQAGWNRCNLSIYLCSCLY